MNIGSTAIPTAQAYANATLAANTQHDALSFNVDQQVDESHAAKTPSSPEENQSIGVLKQLPNAIEIGLADRLFELYAQLLAEAEARGKVFDLQPHLTEIAAERYESTQEDVFKNVRWQSRAWHSQVTSPDNTMRNIQFKTKPMAFSL